MGLSRILNKKIINISGNTLGLEINDLSVRVIQLDKRGKRGSIVGYGSSMIAEGSMLDGEIINEDNVVVAVKEAINKSKPKKIRAKKAICSVSETKAFLRIIDLPKMKKKEVAEAIKWEIEANIPLSVDQVYYDWQISEKNFSKENGKMSVLVIAVSRRIVDPLLGVLKKSGLESMDIEIESISQARSLLDEREKNKTVMLIDIGGKRTSFLISVNNIPCFTSSIPLSAKSLTDAIVGKMKTSFKEAEKTKLNYGIGSFVDNDPIFQAVKPVLENFVSEIEKSMDFYLNGLKYSSSIDRVIACGGGANTKGLIPYLTKRLSKEIELGDPWVNFNMDKKIPLINKENAVKYSTVIGLALRGLYYEDIY